MPNTNYLIGGLLNAKIGEVNTTPDHAVGTRAEGNNGSEWMFVGPATAAIAQYNVVWINGTFVPANLTPTLVKTAGFVGFAQVAFATSDYGWVMLSGKPTINCPVNTNGGVPLYTSDTAGFLDDATVSASQMQIFGVVLTVSNGSTTAGTAIAAFPTVRGVNLVQ